jgi:hypothetical protein
MIPTPENFGWQVDGRVATITSIGRSARIR